MICPLVKYTGAATGIDLCDAQFFGIQLRHQIFKRFGVGRNFQFH
jgi:hypothetical protein